MTTQITTRTQMQTNALANYIPNTFLFEVKPDVLKAKVLKLFCQALNFKGISKTEDMLNSMVEMFKNKLQSDYSHINFEQVERALMRADFEYGENEHFNVSPDMFVKILKEAGLDRQSFECRQAIANAQAEQERKAKEEAARKYYKENEEQILKNYTNKAYEQWLHLGRAYSYTAAYKYLNTYKKLFTDRDRQEAEQHIAERAKERQEQNYLHTTKVREQAAKILQNSTKEKSIGKLITDFEPTIIKATDKDIEQELVLMAFEKRAKELGNKTFAEKQKVKEKNNQKSKYNE